MAFAFRRDEGIGDGARRVVAKQLAKAVDELARREGGDLRAVVHGVRKRTKKARAVVRLVRPGLGEDYRRTNVPVRDAARLLSPIRDGQALLVTFDALVASAGSRPVGDLRAVRIGLAARADAATARAAHQDDDVDAAIEGLRSASSIVEGWDLDGEVDLLAEGLEAAARRGRDAFRAARDQPSAERFHEWRKATKHLWHHTQLLKPAAPSLLSAQAQAFHHLADALGDDHDLAVLVGLLGEDEAAFGGQDAVNAAVTLAAERRADLERRALALGARLHVEKPKAFASRLTGCWEAWHEHGDEEVTGEIAQVAPPADDLADRSRRELYAMAQAADVPGRSRMGRDDLLATLRAMGR